MNVLGWLWAIIFHLLRTFLPDISMVQTHKDKNHFNEPMRKSKKNPLILEPHVSRSKSITSKDTQWNNILGDCGSSGFIYNHRQKKNMMICCCCCLKFSHFHTPLPFLSPFPLPLKLFFPQVFLPLPCLPCVWTTGFN